VNKKNRMVPGANREPALYRLGTQMIRSKRPGGYLLIQVAARLGLLNRVVRHSLTEHVSITVPLFTDNLWTAETVKTYEACFIASLAPEVARLDSPVTLIDCGASFGLFSCRMAAAAPKLAAITAFEPNPKMHAILAANLAALPVRAQALNAAVSDFVGRGELRNPDYDRSPDAAYLIPTESGGISVRTVDSVPVSTPALILKIDVEGAELQVLRGANETLRRAADFVVAIEASYDVWERTGTDPMECVRAIQLVRPCSAFISERPEIQLRLDIPFFSQVPDRKTYNVICRSTGGNRSPG